LRDLCVHRGTALSLGWVDRGRLVCAYHGWTFGADGACVRIPSLPADRAIPRKARARAYHCQERYGLVWVCLADEPREPIPPFPEWDDPSYTMVIAGPFLWKASAPRIVENNFDQTHLPWVHEGILGTRDKAEVPGRRATREGNVLVVPYTQEEPKPTVVQAHSTADGDATVYDYVFRVYMPLHTHGSKVSRHGERSVFFLAICPLSAKESLVFDVVGRDFARDLVDDAFRDRAAYLLNQDRQMVETQRPEELPVDLAAELHLSNEHSAVEYRRWLAELGVEDPPGAQLVDALARA
jgi:vanillate O-demethylase monooxygenase subunit